VTQAKGSPHRWRASRAGHLGVTLALCSGLSACVTAADGPRGAATLPKVAATRPASTRDPAVATAVLAEDAGSKPAGPRPGREAAAAPVAAARYEGTSAPGVQIRLVGEGSSGSGLRYRWVQTQGPKADMIGPDRATARVTVPDGARTLGFLLVVGNEAGMDQIALTVPVEGRPKAPSEGDPRADAGDDQIGIVGRQITLNGTRSEPRGKIGYRWLQVGGPAVRLKIEEGPIFSFVPTEPGLHRFALVVAVGSQISEADEVAVAVEFAAARGDRGDDAPRPAPLPSLAPESERLGQFVRVALAGLDGGPARGEAMAQTFEGVAGRIGLFRCYDETYSEISRRLDAIVPQEAATRAAWIERFFAPMTTRIVEELRKEGLDIATEAGRAAPMTEAQRGRMAEVFRAIAEGSRATARTQ